MIAIVALRFAIGFHFANEGLSKIVYGNFTAVPFLSSAKGPFADNFQAMIYDPQGKVLLAYQLDETDRPIYDLDPTKDYWDRYLQVVEKRYRFNDERKLMAQKVYKENVEILEAWFRDNSEDIIKYFNNLDRQKEQAKKGYQFVDSLAGQADTLNSEIKKQKSLVAQVNKIWDNYEKDVLGLVTRDERSESTAPVRLWRPGQQAREGMTDTKLAFYIPYFDLAVGILLIVCLLTPVASIAGACLLAGVCITQFPGSPGAIPIYYQSIEMVGLLVLAGVGAGRFLGLDYFGYALMASLRTPSTGN